MDDIKRQFHAAARSGDVVIVRRMMDDGIRIERDYGDGYHPMVLAAEFGFDDLVDKYHADGGISDHVYSEALHIAAEHGNRAMVEKIIALTGFDPKSTDLFDLSLAAAIGGQLDLLLHFEREGIRTDFTHPILMEAVVEHDHGHILDFMLDRGASLQTAADVARKTANRYNKTFPSIDQTITGWAERGITIILDPDRIDTIGQLREIDTARDGIRLTRLMRMAQAGKIGDALKIARHDRTDKLTPRDFMSMDDFGNTAIEVIGEKKQLALLFDAALFKNGMADLDALYALTPPIYKEQTGFVQLRAENKAETLRNKARAFGAFKRGNNPK